MFALPKTKYCYNLFGNHNSFVFTTNTYYNIKLPIILFGSLAARKIKRHGENIILDKENDIINSVIEIKKHTLYSIVSVNRYESGI